MEANNARLVAANEHNFEWTVHITEKSKVYSSSLFEIKSSPGLNFHLSAQVDTSNTLLKIQVMKTYTKSAIAAVELQVANMAPIIKDVTNWKNVIEFDRIPISCASDDCQKNTWNVCNLTTPDSHEFRIKITCSIIWYGFVEDLFRPNLFEDICKFLGKSEHSDVIICIDKFRIPAHKVLLASQSPVLAQKISIAELDESKNLTIDLGPDVDANVINEMMLFLYHGKLDKAHTDYDTAFVLFKFAGEMKLDKLKDVCGVILSLNLAFDNVLMLLELARKYKSLVLQQRAMIFIINNRKLLFYNCS